jgi:hypothetical protein
MPKNKEVVLVKWNNIEANLNLESQINFNMENFLEESLFDEPGDLSEPKI